MTALSVIIPVLNDSVPLARLLPELQPLRERDAEVIVVDGGGMDDELGSFAALTDQILRSARGRARQMNAGARIARGRVLWFLHADTRLPADADWMIRDALASGRDWGRFDVRLSGYHPALRVVETLMNLRSRLTGIATGDQGLFVTRAAFKAVGGYPEIALMEDIALSQRLKRLSRPICLRARLITSSRRWERDGILRTVLLMWRLRLAYRLGANPDRLAQRYYGA
ncbi:MAG: TIGR04283 family arsenosugar biosynthesis glycosyltransferase [Candidatus Competibacterales bacterium]|nr:TIGR04283 family arsenosugar biosynthesis glycosyltransferase [Candidatus Competibacterales bacterium]